jgi:hypothetical protein
MCTRIRCPCVSQLDPLLARVSPPLPRTPPRPSSFDTQRVDEAPVEAEASQERAGSDQGQTWREGSSEGEAVLDPMPCLQV